jgi:methionine aminopeptidase
MAKVDLGVHFDGFCALAGHTVIVGEEQSEGKKAEIVLAAHQAIQAAFRTLKPGNKNTEATVRI